MSRADVSRLGRAADQTIFAALDVEPDNYQNYDKAFDVYYLALAYISTIRNWPRPAAFGVGRGLWFYRLVGVTAFEYSGARVLLLIFPNTFEYFFIAYEAVRTRWNPARLAAGSVVAMAAAIWIFIKLPQEFWIHVARLDVTDTLAAYPALWLVVVGLPVAAAAALHLNRHRFPSTDWPFTVEADSTPTTVVTAPGRPPDADTRLTRPLVEKTILVGLIVAIFFQLLPSSTAGLVPILVWVGAIIVVNSVVSSFLSGRSAGWTSFTRSFVGTGLINLGIVVPLRWLQPDEAIAAEGFTLFLIAILTLVVVLYDRHRALRRSGGTTTVPLADQPVSQATPSRSRSNPAR